MSADTYHRRGGDPHGGRGGRSMIPSTMNPTATSAISSFCAHNGIHAEVSHGSNSNAGMQGGRKPGQPSHHPGPRGYGHEGGYGDDCGRNHYASQPQQPSADCGITEVFDPEFKFIYDVPTRCVVHLPPARLNITRLVLCRNYACGEPGSCGMGHNCKFVHADCCYESLEAHPIHVNYIWRSPTCCTYPRLKDVPVPSLRIKAPAKTSEAHGEEAEGGEEPTAAREVEEEVKEEVEEDVMPEVTATLEVMQPNGRQPAVLVPIDRVLPTKGSQTFHCWLATHRANCCAGEGCDPFMDNATGLISCPHCPPVPPLSHCAHYYFNRMCNRGERCNFIHAIYVDPNVQGGDFKRVPARWRRFTNADGSSHNESGCPFQGEHGSSGGVVPYPIAPSSLALMANHGSSGGAGTEHRPRAHGNHTAPPPPPPPAQGHRMRNSSPTNANMVHNMIHVNECPTSKAAPVMVAGPQPVPGRRIYVQPCPKGTTPILENAQDVGANRPNAMPDTSRSTAVPSPPALSSFPSRLPPYVRQAVPGSGITPPTPAASSVVNAPCSATRAITPAVASALSSTPQAESGSGSQDENFAEGEESGEFPLPAFATLEHSTTSSAANRRSQAGGSLGHRHTATVAGATSVDESFNNSTSDLGDFTPNRMGSHAGSAVRAYRSGVGNCVGQSRPHLPASGNTSSPPHFDFIGHSLSSQNSSTSNLAMTFSSTNCGGGSGSSPMHTSASRRRCAGTSNTAVTGHGANVAAAAAAAYADAHGNSGVFPPTGVESSPLVTFVPVQSDDEAHLHGTSGIACHHSMNDTCPLQQHQQQYRPVTPMQRSQQNSASRGSCPQHALATSTTSTTSRTYRHDPYGSITTLE